MQDVRGFKAIELQPSRPLDPRERFHALAGREISCSLIAIADDHRHRLCHTITRYVMRNVLLAAGRRALIATVGKSHSSGLVALLTDTSTSAMIFENARDMAKRLGAAG